MAADQSAPITLVFIGHAPVATAAQAAAYEDAVLPLLADHGGLLVYRGRRADAGAEASPFEVHVLWFPDRAAYDAYLADDRRVDLLRAFGDVFASKQIVEMETIAVGPLPR